MKKGEPGFRISSSVSAYDEAMDALSSLITKKCRADKMVVDHRYELMFDYVKILELEEPISKMKIIHVAGTKGKGSRCVYTEAILRNCGFHTGPFTSPHLIDVRERFRLNGKNAVIYSNAVFILLPCFTCFQNICSRVDVAIMEVGLGGRIDATNMVQTPIVCGITPLGYDHTKVLGNILGAIAGEKAGIFKKGVPAFTVSQPEEAMEVLNKKALIRKLPNWMTHHHVKHHVALQDRSPGNRILRSDYGAHSPESMEVCANWFSIANKEDNSLKESSQV
ncbi:hypothetical protein L2E82_07426 [Cichorium intybus]|uniref:Uncharacterized protein n=1 Tax=Cichorium intybus TaxID=13427 RepID=A0ACB9G5E6_CICIN|nr:hypothetical protein L2E82_07426 [Cichorium intybus]